MSSTPPEETPRYPAPGTVAGARMPIPRPPQPLPRPGAAIPSQVDGLLRPGCILHAQEILEDPDRPLGCRGEELDVRELGGIEDRLLALPHPILLRDLRSRRIAKASR